MKLSSGVEWGLHCCLVLSHAQSPVPASQLAELHGVSPTYLAKHLQALTRAGLTRSAQGQVGGYVLTRRPAEISVLDVVQAIDGLEPAFRCTEIRQRGPLAARKADCVLPCAIAKAMADAEAAWRASLAGVSIADLVANVDRNTDGTVSVKTRDWLADAAG